MDGATATCSQCGFENRPNKRFCAGCGHPLAPVCASCGTENLPGARFCDECGTPLSSAAAGAVAAAPPPAATAQPVVVPAVSQPHSIAGTTGEGGPAQHEERRLVTAVFCDLVGFTSLSEQLDPEEVRAIQTEYFAAMRESIERYGGTLQKYAGDAVLAFFGAPVAHEDDAERAVLCGLDMQRSMAVVGDRLRKTWGAEPRIRVGINTGEVVSGIWDTGSRQDLDVTGDAINTAARIQAAAEPGEVLVGGETMWLTRRRIEYGGRRELALRGKAAVVSTYRAEGVRGALRERWEEAPRMTPLVGRERELHSLLDAWNRAQSGEGALVSLVGEPGVGKSRLVAEILERITAVPSVRVVRGRCLSYGQEISLWLLADLLRNLLGIREQDGSEEVRAQLAATVPTILAAHDPEDQNEARDVLGEVLGLPAAGSWVAGAGPEVRRNALVRSLRHLLAALAEPAPLVMVLEDLHWIDQASQDVLGEILVDVPRLHILVVTTHRAGWNGPWVAWGWPERIVLRPLRQDDAAALVGAILGGAQPSPELAEYLTERAAGNPFFVEELLRALEETVGLVRDNGHVKLAPGSAEKLPTTLTEVLLSRLDRLEGPVKSVAQVGSVIGRNFAVRLLAQVLGRERTALEPPLVALQHAEIAFPQRAPDPVYAFKHVTMRDAAYNTLVRKRRRELHLQTARAMAQLYPLDEYVEMIAYHYAKAQVPEAWEWLERAGDRAASIYANEAAIAHYQEALKRLAAEPGPTTRLEEKLGGALYAAGRYDESLAHLHRAVALYRERHDLEGLGRATALQGMAHRYRGTPEEGITLVRPMIDHLAAGGPSRAFAALYLALSSLLFLVGRYREQLEAADRAEEIARLIADHRLRGEAQERRGLALTMLGRTEEALPTLEMAIAFLEGTGDLFVLWRAFNNAAVASARLGKMDRARQFTERALEVARRVGNVDQTTFILSNLGNILITLGDWQGARERLEEAIGLLGEAKAANAAILWHNLGQIALHEGKWEEAERYLAETVALTDRTGDRETRELTQSSLAELDILSGRPLDAVHRLEELATVEEVDPMILPILAWAHPEAGNIARALGVAGDVARRAREAGERFLEVDALRVQGMALARKGDREGAETAFEAALGLARALPNPYAEARILFQQGAMQITAGATEQARERLHAAREIFHRLGAAKDLALAEQVLAGCVPSFTPGAHHGARLR